MRKTLKSQSVVRCVTIGDLLEEIDVRNSDGSINDVRGVNINKQFIPTAANISGIDLTKYKVVRKNQFAANFMHVLRDQKIPFGLYRKNEPCIVSPAYPVFQVKSDATLPEYIMMWLNRAERDRYAWFVSDSSVRGGLELSRFFEIEISLPPLAIQQKYVNIYNAMLANFSIQVNSLKNVTAALVASIEMVRRGTPRVAIGVLLEEIDVRNSSGEIKNAQGININKEFMPSVANLSGTDLTKYKVVKKNQFAYSAMQTGRDECIRMALFQGDEPIIVSPAYSVLQIRGNSVLAEYVMLWFSRCESDRYGWFISDGSIRASLELPRFYEIEIPLPSLEQQRAVANLYNARRLMQRNITALGNMLRDICPILIKGAQEEGTAAHGGRK